MIIDSLTKSKSYGTNGHENGQHAAFRKYGDDFYHRLFIFLCYHVRRVLIHHVINIVLVPLLTNPTGSSRQVLEFFIGTQQPGRSGCKEPKVVFEI